MAIYWTDDSREVILAQAKWQALKKSVNDLESAQIRTWLARLREEAMR